MLLDNKKLKITLLTLFVGAWIFGVGQLGYARYQANNKNFDKELSLAKETVQNKSVILTGIVGVFHYIYEK
jgi:hypothetical protein